MADVTYEQLLELYDTASVYVASAFGMGLFLCTCAALSVGLLFALIITNHWRA